MRALRRDVLPRLDLRTTGMEFASEMVIRAAKADLRDRRVPDRIPPARRRVEAVELPRRLAPPALPAGAQPHPPVHPARRAARRPRHADRRCWSARGLDFFGRSWDIHALIGGALLMIVGTQVLALGLCAHAYGTYFMGERTPGSTDARALPPRARPAARRRLHAGRLRARRGDRRHWISHGFGALGGRTLAVVAATLLIVGVQIFFSSFLLSILGLRRG